MTRARSNSGGFTLVELTVVLAVLVPLILVVASASQAVTGTFKAIETAAAQSETALRSIAEIEGVLLGGRWETLRVPANQADVDARRASAVGEWCAMPPDDPRQSLQVRATTGEIGLALVVPSRLNEFSFVPDASDPTDGIDNDGDGIVDERTLQWTRAGVTTVVAKNLEQCSFRRDGHSIRIALRLAVTGHGGAVRRMNIEHTVRLNNP